MPESAPACDVLVVADAGAQASLGHLARCSAIILALRERAVRCRAVALGVQESPPGPIEWERAGDLSELPVVSPRLLLVDSYLSDSRQVRARTGGTRLAVMHDIGPLPDEADLVLTSDPALAGMRAGVIGGPQLYCLGPDYWSLPEPRRPPETVACVLVTTGGGDPGGHGVAIATALRSALREAEIVLVRGPHAPAGGPSGVRLLEAPESLAGALRDSDLTVTSAGNSLKEALAVGSPTLAVILAENQRAGAAALAGAGATELVAPTPLGPLVTAAVTLAGDRELREGRVRAGRTLVDGQGARRVAGCLQTLL